MTELLGDGLILRHPLAERELLLAYLARQRELLCWKVEGLEDAGAGGQDADQTHGARAGGAPDRC